MKRRTANAIWRLGRWWRFQHFCGCYQYLRGQITGTAWMKNASTLVLKGRNTIVPRSNGKNGAKLSAEPRSSGLSHSKASPQSLPHAVCCKTTVLGKTSCDPNTLDPPFHTGNPQHILATTKRMCLQLQGKVEEKQAENQVHRQQHGFHSNTTSFLLALKHKKEYVHTGNTFCDFCGIRLINPNEIKLSN